MACGRPHLATPNRGSIASVRRQPLRRSARLKNNHCQEVVQPGIKKREREADHQNCASTEPASKRARKSAFNQDASPQETLGSGKQNSTDACRRGHWGPKEYPEQINSITKVTTYRLRGIPVSYSLQAVESLVRDILELGDVINVKVRSLADSPYPQPEKVATLNFSSTPSRLCGGPNLDEWCFDIPYDGQQEQARPCLVFDTHFRGFTPLHGQGDADCEIDLIAISGLGGHAFGSFKEKNGSHMWLRDSLPTDLPNTRILVYGYDTHLFKSESFQNIKDLGIQFRNSINTIRSCLYGSSSLRPLFLLGHSLGGIIIKQALIEMQDEDQGDKFNQANLKSISGVLFFGVPNRGMSIESLIPMARQFQKTFTSRDFQIISFYETKRSPTAKKVNGRWEMKGPLIVLVDVHSATSGREWEFSTKYLHPIDRNHSELVKFSKQDSDYQTVLHHLSTFKEDASNVIRTRFDRSSVGELTNLSEEEQACLQSLAFEEESRRRGNILRPSSETCNWLLSHPIYKSWLNEPQGLLWVKGKPGAGKSTLINFAAYDSERRPLIRDQVVISFFFDGRGADIQKNYLGMCRSLLNQLLSCFPDKLAQLTSTFQQRCHTKGKVGEKWDWNVEELKDFLVSTLCEMSLVRPILVYVDALDETGEATAVKLVAYFKRILAELTHTKASLKICFSCRHYPIIALNNGREICVEMENEKALQTHVENELANQGLKPDTARILKQEVVERARGVFQWVVLVVPRVLSLDRKGETLERIRSAIQAIPSDLNNLYNSLLQFSEEEDRLRSLKLLEWICFASRPLTLRELQHAMAISTNEAVVVSQESDHHAEIEERFQRTIVHLSRGLAEIKRTWNGQIVQLGHQSVRDFLINDGLKMLAHLPQYTVPGYGHFHLSRSCIKCFSMKELRGLERWGMNKIISIYPLLDYATTSWTFHAEEVEKEGLPQDDVLGLFGWPSNDIIESWIRVSRQLDPFNCDAPVPGTTLLLVAARHGLSSVAKAILKSSTSTDDLKDSKGRTALSWASENGHSKAVKCLLDIRWVKPDSKDNEMRTPLFHAAKNNRLAVTKLLLAREEVSINIANYSGETPLLSAAANAGTAVMEVFLNWRRPEITITEEVLKAAAINSHSGKEVMLLLLEQRGPEITITEEVLKAAARNLQSGKEVMSLLLEQSGPEITITEEVLKAAARNPLSGIEVMSLLLKQRGLEITITEEVLKAAAGNLYRCKEMMSLLLEQRGPEITITEEVLKAAAGNWINSEEVMSLLLKQRGLEITITEEVLKAAVGNSLSGIEVMSLLLKERGLEITITEEVLKTTAGNLNRCKEMMSLLLEQRELEITITEEVLKAAAGNSRNGEELMSLLLDQRGPEITITEEVLKVAAGNSFSGEEIMSLLLEQRGPEITITEEVLKAAAGNSPSGREVMSLLLYQREPEITITEEVLKAATRNEKTGKEVMLVLTAFLRKRGTNTR